MNGFNDHQLTLFYNRLLTCITTRQKDNVQQTYQNMINILNEQLSYPAWSLEDRAKIHASFVAIIEASPLYREFTPQLQNEIHIHLHQYCPENNRFSDNFLTLIALNQLTNRPIAYPSSRVHGHNFPSNMHHHPSNSDRRSESDLQKIFFVLILIALAAIVVMLTFISLYYLANAIGDSLERLSFNEGYTQALLILSSTIAHASASTVISLTMAYAPLCSLALIVGFNPLGLVVISTIAFAVMGGAIGAGVANLLSYRFQNNEAMDAKDPSRFRLTTEEENNLTEKNLDPIKVKCAIVALHHEIEALGSASFLQRHFGNHDKRKVQNLLTTIRQLRLGDVQDVTVGEFTFHCKIMPPVQLAVANPYEYYSQQGSYYQQQPSFIFTAYSDREEPPPPYTAPSAPELSLLG